MPAQTVPSEPSFAELMDRGYAIVVAASPRHPTRRWVEWLVGEHERGTRAIDALLAGRFLKASDRGQRLMLGERRRTVEFAARTAGSDAMGFKAKHGAS